MADSLDRKLALVDWAIVLLYPLLSLAIGIAVYRVVRGMRTFVVAGQKLGMWLGVASITGTELGLVTVMYSAEKGFVGGFAAFHIALAGFVATLFVGITGLFVHRLRELGVMTIPEFYEIRFDRTTRVLGGLMMAAGGILNMGLFLKVGSMFLVGVLGLSEHNAALPIAMTILLVVVLIYTCLGGMVSVVVTDYVQFVVLSFGMLATTAIVLYREGWTRLFSQIQQLMGPAGLDPTAAGSFGWEYMVWMLFVGLVSCAIWPTAVARALSMESPRAVVRQYLWSSISFLIRFLIPYLWGIGAFVFVQSSGELRNLFFPDASAGAGLDDLYATPIYLGAILPAGLLGIMVAAMLAAFMSTHDSYLLCWATVLVQDVIAPLYERGGRRISENVRVWLSRALIVAIGAYVWYWGIWYHGSEDIWDYMAVTGAVYFSGAFALLWGGLYWKSASSFGARLALIGGVVAVLGLQPVQQAIGVDWAPERVGLVSIAITSLLLVVGSFLRPDRGRQAEQPFEPVGLRAWLLGAALLVGFVGLILLVRAYGAWSALWQATLAAGLGAFTVVAVLGTVGGMRDLVRLFRALWSATTVDAAENHAPPGP